MIFNGWSIYDKMHYDTNHYKNFKLVGPDQTKKAENR